MKTTTTRPLTEEERRKLEDLLKPKRREKPAFVMAILVAVPLTFALFVFLNLLLPGPALPKLLVALGLGGSGAWFYGKRATAKYEESFQPAPEVQEVLRKDLAEGRAAVTRYDVESVVKVAAERERLVLSTWFVKRTDGVVSFLVQPDLMEAELAGDFPATAFEIATGESSHFVVSVKRLGERLDPVKVRSPLSDGEWEEIGDEADAPVPLSWDEVLERAVRNPLRAKNAKKE
ncbi:MAG: hypothetical protein IPP07_07525 [Holophagales bacterium]|nr:hypothetical protein [Holophagales bacterium]MBK9964751.1 hypothetical protein [Holophagales bacterium]